MNSGPIGTKHYSMVAAIEQRESLTKVIQLTRATAPSGEHGGEHQEKTG
jgi:hypothetical protein